MERLEAEWKAEKGEREQEQETNRLLEKKVLEVESENDYQQQQVAEMQYKVSQIEERIQVFEVRVATNVS